MDLLVRALCWLRVMIFTGGLWYFQHHGCSETPQRQFGYLRTANVGTEHGNKNESE